MSLLRRRKRESCTFVEAVFQVCRDGGEVESLCTGHAVSELEMFPLSVVGLGTSLVPSRRCLGSLVGSCLL